MDEEDRNIVTIDGYSDKDGSPASVNNKANTGQAAELNTYLYRALESKETTVNITVKKSDDDKTPAKYRLVLRMKSNNTAVKEVIANIGTSYENKDTTESLETHNGKPYGIYNVFIPVDKADPNKLIYTELLSVRPEDKTSEVSLDGGDFSVVDADGVYTKRVVLTNKTFDANNDGTPDTFIVPMKVKSQSGDIKEYKIYVTVSDLDLDLTSVKTPFSA